MKQFMQVLHSLMDYLWSTAKQIL